MKKLPKLKKLTAVFGVALAVVLISTTFGNAGLIGLLYLLLRSTSMRLKLTERKLTCCQNRLQTLIDASGECIELIAQDSTLLKINTYGIKMMEVDDATELLGKSVGMRVASEYREAFAALHESVCQGNRQTLELEIISSKGTRRWVETHAVPLLNEDDTFLHLSVTRDITESKLTSAQLLRFQRLDTIGSLASGIAHDLNNTLSPILMSVQLLQIKLQAEQHQQLLQTLENNVKRGVSLVRQILSFARGVDEQTVIDFKTVFSEIELLIIQTFPKSIVCQTSVAPNLACVIGNTTQIHQVLMNLVINARDAMPQGGKLTITAEQGDFILITVTDTGVGIPASIQERIFEPFFTTKEHNKGNGLGLSTTKTIIKNHGGFINVSSKVGEGTCFKVYLPAQPIQTPDISTERKLLTKQEDFILI
jgi:two-component system, cell cycle sensor histidine kinase and response regulator CckA